MRESQCFGGQCPVSGDFMRQVLSAEASDWSEAAMKASDWLMSPHTCDTAITEEDQNNNKSLT